MQVKITDRKDIILVPHDFTEIGENALQYAVIIAKDTKYEIYITHIVKNEAILEEAKETLKKIAEKTQKKHKVKITPITKTGSIFTTINEIGDEIQAKLVVMGTHGMKGVQKVTGSWALKVISHSGIPYIVVQEKPTGKSFNKIVFPLDYKKEDKEKLNWVYYLAQNYKSKFYVFKARKTDPLLRRGLELNLSFCIKFFEKLGVDYDIHTSEGKGDFAKETIEYANKIEADMLLIMTTKNITFTDYIFGASEQYIIANNSKIPVMCVNPKESGNLGSFSASG